MREYFLRRLVSLVFVLLGMSVLAFVISHLIPADPARAAAGPAASGEAIENIRKRMGLDLPLYEQYAMYMGRLLRGDLGESIEGYRPVLDEIRQRVPASLELALFSLAIAVPIGLLLGVVCALRPGGALDALGRAFATLGMSIPIFVLALLMQLILYARLGLLPAAGRIDEAIGAPTTITGLYLVDSLVTGNLPAFVSALKHIIAPALTLAFGVLGGLTRITRSSMLEVLHQDYVRTARAKGLEERAVLLRHALKNAMVPVVTVIGLELAGLIAWVFLVELVFAWPGIGSWAVHAIMVLDFNSVMGVTLVFSLLYVFINFAVDMAYVAFDPRIRY
jgi:peptide/nickel transport system permease protein